MTILQDAMNYLSIAFAVAAFAVGLVAALYWWEASMVKPDPAYPEIVKQNPADAMLVNSMQLWGLVDAMKESSRLNKKAALLTALAVVLSTASALISAFCT